MTLPTIVEPVSKSAIVRSVAQQAMFGQYGPDIASEKYVVSSRAVTGIYPRGKKARDEQSMEEAV